MKRILIDYKKLDPHLTALLIDSYPNGYGDEDIVAFKNHKGEFIEAVELRTEDSLYLVKISQSLSHFIANFDDTIINELEVDEQPESEEPALELNLEAEYEGDDDLD
jgi:hypothetical protein